METEKFPKTYALYHGAIVLTSILGFGGIGLVIAIWWFGAINMSKGAVIHFHYFDWAFFIFVMYFLFLGVTLGLGLFISKIALMFPRFGRFVKREQLRNLPSRLMNRLDYKKEYNLAMLYLVLMLVIGTPVLVLASDSYAYVKEDGIYYNDFFSLGEKHAEFDEIIKVKVSKWQEYGTENVSYTIILQDGTEIRIWKGVFSPTLQRIDEERVKRNIPLEVNF